MWIASKIGFFSIVAHRDQPGTVMIRARIKGDLENLLAALWDLEDPQPPIVDTPQADYRFRIIVSQPHAVSLVSRLAASIDYSNLKETVADQPDQRDKLPAYSSLWGNLRRLQP